MLLVCDMKFAHLLHLPQGQQHSLCQTYRHQQVNLHWSVEDFAECCMHCTEQEVTTGRTM